MARNISNMSGLGHQFDALYGESKGVAGDKSKLISAYKKKLSSPAFSKADAMQGRLVFQKPVLPVIKCMVKVGSLGLT